MGFKNTLSNIPEKPAHGGDVWDAFPLIDFSSNINPFGPCASAVEAVRKSIDKIQYYPDPRALELKKAISEYAGVDSENITVGNGSTELIRNFAECTAGTTLIVEPTFSEYEFYSRLNGSRVSHLYDLNEDMLARELTGVTKLFICNPNNPTGRSIREKNILKILEVAAESGTTVFLDEAYIEFTDMRSICWRVYEFENLFVLRSLTKFFSLPGLRLGYGIGNKKLIEDMEKLRTPWNVNVLASAAGIASMRDADFIKTSRKAVRKEKEFLLKKLAGAGVRVNSSEANFFLIDMSEVGMRAREMKDLLLCDGLLVRDCTSFRGMGEYFIRVSVRRRKENTVLIEHLRRILGEQNEG